MNGPDIIAEYNSDWSTLQQHYTHGPRMDEPLMRMQGSNFSAVDYYHADALSSVVMMTGPVNTQANPPSIPVNNINFYTAWGLRSSLAPAAIQPYTFTGREADAVGQIYMRNRYYAPRFGRFTQPDPKGFIDGINTYAYVMNAPVNYVDPWGTVATSFSNTISSAGSYIDMGWASPDAYQFMWASNDGFASYFGERVMNGQVRNDIFTYGGSLLSSFTFGLIEPSFADRSSSAYEVGQYTSLAFGTAGVVRSVYFAGTRGLSALAASSVRNAAKFTNPAILLDASQRAKHLIPSSQRLIDAGSAAELARKVGSTNTAVDRVLIPLTPFIGERFNGE